MTDPGSSLPEVLYIAGYGRSGSTLLDILLDSHDHIFGAGELTSLFENMQEDRICSCGEKLSDCPFWMEVKSRISTPLAGLGLKEAAQLTLSVEAVHRIRRNREAYQTLWCAVLKAIRAVSGAAIVVDSSKSARLTCGRLAAFYSAGIPIKGVHLVRDPRAVMWSIQRGCNIRLEKGESAALSGGMLRGMIGWCLVNAQVDRMRRAHPDIPVIRITYDQMIRNTDDVLEQLGQLMGLSLDPVLEKMRTGAVINSGHGIAGNRMRRKGKIVLKEDEEWKREMPGWARAAACCTAPLRKKYKLD